MRSASILFIAAIAASSACDKGTNVPGDGSGYRVVPATYGENANAPDETREKCEFDEELTREVAEAVATVKDGKGKVITLVVSRMRGAEPTWEGEISVIVEGELESDGVVLGNFRAQRRALGGVSGGMSGVCRGLDDIAEALAEDIAKWLDKPGTDDEIGTFS